MKKDFWRVKEKQITTDCMNTSVSTVHLTALSARWHCHLHAHFLKNSVHFDGLWELVFETGQWYVFNLPYWPSASLPVEQSTHFQLGANSLTLRSHHRCHPAAANRCGCRQIKRAGVSGTLHLWDGTGRGNGPLWQRQPGWWMGPSETS